MYIRNNVNAALLESYVSPENVEAFLIKIFLKSYKWLICCSYNQNKINVASHLGEIGKVLDTYSKKYENALLMGDFNVEPDKTNIKAFCKLV